ncbi:unnamed protein product [Spodoptera littoralis]|uniref:Uncharacterized protein n=1 Tax=Spodoptera littoralis TaxID=7109 RepID=A0A9P0IL60_SPOLI|nr:unnamed protein product [Spodoptera littoralis]CAH1647018.1 unnamed protein product [Spodoptera littoralis]
MADKLHEYQGVTGRLHGARDRYKERWSRWREQHPRGVRDVVAETLFGIPNSDEPPERVWQDSAYSDLYSTTPLSLTKSVAGRSGRGGGAPDQLCASPARRVSRRCGPHVRCVNTSGALKA